MKTTTASELKWRTQQARRSEVTEDKIKTAAALLQRASEAIGDMAHESDRDATTPTICKDIERFLADFLPRHKIVVEGRRWFSATYGNTYHTVKVWIDDRPAITSGEVYGYGDQYLQTAAEIVRTELPELGDPSRSPLTLWARDNNIDLKYTVSDGRRKDLHKGGSYRGR